MSRAESKKAVISFEETVPHEFLCPITTEPMTNPVVAADGHTYERQAIEQWIQMKGARAISPKTGARLANTVLRPNHALRQTIEDFPNLQRRQLNTQDYVLAIQLRQKELEARLQKESERTQAAVQSAEASKADLQARIQALETQLQHYQHSDDIHNPALRQKLAAIQQTEIKWQHQQQHLSALRIQRRWLQKKLSTFIQATPLQKQREDLLLQKMQLNSAHQDKERQALENIAQITQNKQWSQLAAAATQREQEQKEWEANHQAQDKMLQQVATAKTAKKRQVTQQVQRLDKLTAATHQQKTQMSDYTRQQMTQSTAVYEFFQSRQPADIADIKSPQPVQRNPGTKTQKRKKKKKSAALSSQGLMPAPQPRLTAEQAALQNQLITACEQGDSKAVTVALQKGAKADAANEDGKQPLGAGVWGMNPEVTNMLLQHMGGRSPMTWQACEAHNLKHYHGTFIVSDFNPQTWGGWRDLVNNIDLNGYVRGIHLREAQDIYRKAKHTDSWGAFKVWIEAAPYEDKRPLPVVKFGARYIYSYNANQTVLCERTKTAYDENQKQIKQGIESAVRIQVGNTI